MSNDTNFGLFGHYVAFGSGLLTVPNDPLVKPLLFNGGWQCCNSPEIHSATSTPPHVKQRDSSLTVYRLTMTPGLEASLLPAVLKGIDNRPKPHRR